ncbi:unnamed protein product [Triticum turgidum subsp. durum]|uniref:Glutathione S-transferase n=1 Tax=Triticum turgidum subsp. durum TaxID=4567 RepID=A0A9R1BQZ1_TRITD|nr:unnamed protein product [Triticum turgidum subsp. durum]
MALAEGDDKAEAGVRVLGGRMSPFTMRARMALELRGVAYELLEESFEPRKSDRLLAANPVYKKIPVLLLPDGRAVCESGVIAQYVDEAWPAASAAPLLPEDPYQRAMHRFWTAFLHGRASPITKSLEQVLRCHRFKYDDDFFGVTLILPTQIF